MAGQFSSRLAEAIQSMGMSPTEFARKARIPQGTISKCLSGHVPTARILMRISKFTGKSVDWLLLGTGQAKAGVGLVAERGARYGRAGVMENAKAGDEVWVRKLLKVLRSSNRRKTQTIKDLLDVLARDE
jgi:transcriptional regulator with XRE-family HTH domain